MTKHFVCEQWHNDFSFWWNWYVHLHKYLLLRDELKILNKLQAFAGNPLCGAVCTNSFEKCTYFFANIKNDSRNAPKRRRKTVMLFHTSPLWLNHVDFKGTVHPKMIILSSFLHLMWCQNRAARYCKKLQLQYFVFLQLNICIMKIYRNFHRMA